MKIHVSQLPVEEAKFLTLLDEYRKAREWHSKTVGVPAPFPEFEIFRVIVDHGEEVEIVRDPLQEKAKQAGRDVLAEIDVLRREVAQIKAKLGI